MFDSKYITRSEHRDIKAELAGKPSLKRCLEIIDSLLGKIHIFGDAPYDPEFGDDEICECEHPYYRHFDTYEDMMPVGCKYCDCESFRSQFPKNRKEESLDHQS